MVGYCKKCGFIGGVVFNKKCKYCGTKLSTLSEEMKQKYRIFNDDWSALIFEIRKLETDEEKSKRIDELLSRKDNFIKNEVANNPLFSIEEYENQIKNDKQNFCDIAQYKENKINEQQLRNYTQINGLHYCKKCGRVVLKVADKTGCINDTCDCCKSKVYPIPEKYWLDEDSSFISNEQKQLLIEELVKTSPEFDQYLFDHRDEILAKQSAELNAKLAHGKAILEEQNRRAKCPSCGSSNISKIGTLSRMVSIGFFGLGSSKIGKTHKCNHCGTTW